MAFRPSYALLAAVFVLGAGSARADDDLQVYEVVFKNHTVSPAEIHVPSGKPFVIHVTNTNDAGDEFEMLIPSVERAVAAGGQARLRMRPLVPGRFPFFGENDPDGEKGAIVSE